MSEPIPESVPTSRDPRSHRPTKRQALTPAGQQASQVEALFARPDREIQLPDVNAKPRGVAPPPEIVANVQGSSAGAGSGEFHVYKASRRREYERLRLMDEEVQREKDAVDFARDREEKAAKEAKKSNKNRARRDKAKERKANKGKSEEDTDNSKTKKKPSQPASRNETDKKRPPEDDPPAHPIAEPEVGVVIHDED